MILHCTWAKQTPVDKHRMIVLRIFKAIQFKESVELLFQENNYLNSFHYWWIMAIHYWCQIWNMLIKIKLNFQINSKITSTSKIPEPAGVEVQHNWTIIPHPCPKPMVLGDFQLPSWATWNFIANHDKPGVTSLCKEGRPVWLVCLRYLTNLFGFHRVLEIFPGAWLSVLLSVK